MNSQEYFKKYEPRILEVTSLEDVNKIITDIWLEMSSEVTEIAKQRKTKENGPLLAIMKEQNQKWNALARICIHEAMTGKISANPIMHLAQGLIKENGFLLLWYKQIPQLKMELGEFK